MKDGRYKYILENYIHEGTDSYLNGRLSKAENYGLITNAEEV